MANRKDQQETPGGRSEEVRVPVVEEQLAVGKREVDRGGVRVTATVETVPVQESVRLREEQVEVQRRPVDREATAADLDAFKEGTIEVRQRAEEAVVQKKARVVEEVVVGKQATERTETISDTVRRTDVKIEPVVAETAAGFDRLDTESHFQQNFASGGYSYGDYSYAYRYGWALAADERLQRKSWSTVEPAARSTWEQKNGRTWDQFKDAVKHAFESGK